MKHAFPIANRVQAMVLFTALLCLSVSLPAQDQRFHAGATAGIGLPKIPVSQWRSPLSVAGTLFVNAKITPRFLVQLNGGGLYTFSLGSIDSRSGALRFNLIWGSLDLGIKLRSTMRNETFFIAGGGEFYLSQQFTTETEQYTQGLCLGLTHWTHSRTVSAVFELRWFFLFEPSPHPQVATLMLGIAI